MITIKKNQLKGAFFLITAAVIWGLSFVAQSKGVEVIGTFTFNGIRTLLGGIVLLPVIAVFSAKKKSNSKQLSSVEQLVENEKKAEEKKNLIRGGLVCGMALFVGGNLQQHSFNYTTVGKVGFITALYMILVPLLGLFLHKKVRPIVWVSVVMGAFGLYLLCASGESATLGKGEGFALAGAVAFAVHILAVDKYSVLVDGVKLSCMQFFVAGGLSCICMFIFETPKWSDILAVAPYILYAGIMSCGVAFTFQILGQRDCEPTVASLLLCLESVFATLFGWLLLKQSLLPRELAGCVIMFAAIILSQLADVKLPRRKLKKEVSR